MSSKSIARRILGIRIVRTLVLGVELSLRLVGRAWSAARTKSLFPGAEGLICHWTVEVKYSENIAIGKSVVIGPNCTLGARSQITLEDGVHLSKGVTIETAGLDVTSPFPYKHVSHPIFVGRETWIGAGALVLGGAEIGERCVIGAGSIVTRKIPASSTVVGHNRIVKSKSRPAL